MEGAVPSLAYGISKAGANYLVRKVHFECEKEGLVALAIHPGYVHFLLPQNLLYKISLSQAL
jgi:norsolorinic acid ketoreductase